MNEPCGKVQYVKEKIFRDVKITYFVAHTYTHCDEKKHLSNQYYQVYYTHSYTIHIIIQFYNLLILNTFDLM